MKRKYYAMPYYAVMAVGILVLLYALLWFYLLYRRAPSYSYIPLSSRYEGDPDSVYRSSLSTMPHYLYQQKLDSINQVQAYYTQTSGSFSLLSGFGVGEFSEHDSLLYKPGMHYMAAGRHKQCYFILNGFKLGEEDIYGPYPRVHYNKQGVSYIKHIQLDSTTGTDGQKTYRLHWVSTPIHYRVTDEPGANPGQKLLLIPIPSDMHTVLDILCWVMMAGYLVLGWLCYRKFMHLLTDIAKGNAFTVKNYRRLFYIAYVIVLVPGGLFFIQLVLQLVFWHYYAGDLITDINWGRNLWYLLVGIVVFLLAKAFQRGYIIQQEQELTI